MSDDIRYSVMCRYENWITDKELKKYKKNWSPWFHFQGSPYFENEIDAQDFLNVKKEQCKHIDKISKLKREFRIDTIDVESIPKIKPKRPRGRPKKNKIEE